MPFVRRGDADIHYETTSGPSPEAPWFLLIPGLSANTRAFPTIVAAMAATYNVVTVDPRGAGLTQPRVANFTLADIAADVVAVLDALRIAQADVLGISMGGMITQELVLGWPERVRTMVLCCTTCGRRPGVRPSPRVIGSLLAGIARPSRGTPKLDMIIDRFGPLLFDQSTPRDIRRGFFAPRVGGSSGAYPGSPTAAGVVAQLLAVRKFGAHSRLATVDRPTLVFHGERDVLVPTVNARILHDAIPGSELDVMPGGHVFFFEHHDRFIERIRRFYDSHPRAAA
ncbi:MAG: alpha/beta fold hydrolase [Myxococcales bacterium]|nr:alpha/beta fold hydrolase [Myxococcales bacterium]MCB9533991.1 alpha/beta fold hydrolase [Myxococcales bacterium]